MNLIKQLLDMKWGVGHTIIALIILLLFIKFSIGELIGVSPWADKPFALPALIIAGVLALIVVLGILSVSFCSFLIN